MLYAEPDIFLLFLCSKINLKSLKKHAANIQLQKSSNKKQKAYRPYTKIAVKPCVEFNYCTIWRISTCSLSVGFLPLNVLIRQTKCYN